MAFTRNRRERMFLILKNLAVSRDFAIDIDFARDIARKCNFIIFSEVLNVTNSSNSAVMFYKEIPKERPCLTEKCGGLELFNRKI